MTTKHSSKQLTKHTVNYCLKLSFFAVIVVLLISMTWLTTIDKITEQQTKQKEQALFSLLANAQYNNNLLASNFKLPSPEVLNLPFEAVAYVASFDNQPQVFIIPTISYNGYNGKIEAWVGVSLHGVITGVQIINHQETPGLGDVIEIKKSNWILQFNQLSLANTNNKNIPVSNNKNKLNVDTITGATITSRAVINAITNALIYFEKNKSVLINLGKKTEENNANNAT